MKTDNVSWEDKIKKELENMRHQLDLACIDTEESICVVNLKLQNYQQLKAGVSVIEQRIKQAPTDSTTENNIRVCPKQKTGKYNKNGKPIYFGDLTSIIVLKKGRFKGISQGRVEHLAPKQLLAILVKRVSEKTPRWPHTVVVLKE
eukprot:12201338-Ditylum_brightwellii.AAC.1